MHFQGLVFSDDPTPLMNSLIQTSSQPPADTSIPLSASGEHARSGWHAIASEHRQDPTTEYGFGRFVRCVWPTEWLREQLGPYALLPDSALASCEISGVQKKGGQWWARIPRFFTTIGVFWSMTYQSPPWQSHGLFDAADEAAVGSLDLGFSLTAHEPNLIVGPHGPVFYEGPKKVSAEGAFRRFEAARPLMDLPPSTRVTLVSWHDTRPQASSPWDFDEEPPCSCVRPWRRKSYGWDEWGAP